MVSFMSGVDKISNNNDDDIRVIQLQKELIELR